jgi:hypothetical protein
MPEEEGGEDCLQLFTTTATPELVAAEQAAKKVLG